MLPLTVGFLIAGPLSGFLSDRFGARPFATGGMVLAALSFGLLEVLPVNFSYIYFALLLLMMGLAMGIFSSPNLAGIMNSLPPEQRGAGAGMLNTFQNSAQVLSIGVFFTLIILGLARTLPHALYNGLVAQGVSSAAAHRAAALPPVASLFAAFLGYNPIRTLLGPSLAHLPAESGHLPHQQGLLPASHRCAVRVRTRRSVHLRRCRLPHRGSGLVASRREYVHGMTVPGGVRDGAAPEPLDVAVASDSQEPGVPADSGAALGGGAR